ncbi:MAG: divalent-cation tolerance protein CutA [Deltaproteobacteria bacterium]|nr:divalent-cation tolerance protein CutA [Deltaproteobacteria bacterium]
MASYVVCLTTVNSRRVAERIGKQLVKRRLIACAGLIPSLTSFYHWKGRLCRDREVLLLIKTKRSLLVRLQKVIHDLHPYELPEFVVLPITGGSKRYLAWIGEQVKG